MYVILNQNTEKLQLQLNKMLYKILIILSLVAAKTYLVIKSCLYNYLLKTTSTEQ